MHSAASMNGLGFNFMNVQANLLLRFLLLLLYHIYNVQMSLILQANRMRKQAVVGCLQLTGLKDNVKSQHRLSSFVQGCSYNHTDAGGGHDPRGKRSLTKNKIFNILSIFQLA